MVHATIALDWNGACQWFSVSLSECMSVKLGLLTDMKGVVVTSVALGKAHAAMLTDRGHVYTFGPNNKGQCGRELTSAAKERTSVHIVH